MKRTGFIMLLCLVSFLAHAAKVDTVMVHANKMNREVKVVVVTPSVDSIKTFPVVYLLHGYGGNAKSWIENVNLSELADQFRSIIVCPDGRNSWYWDSPLNRDSQYETFISNELIAYIDAKFPATPQRHKRAITGLSMGGHGALWNAFRHTDVFGAAGSMSGGVDIRPFPRNWDMGRQLGEYHISPKVWDAHTVINQLDKLKNGDLAIAVECGYDDFFFEVNNALHQALLTRKIGHDYTVRPGRHDWPYWKNAIVYQMLFFKRYFDANP